MEVAYGKRKRKGSGQALLVEVSRLLVWVGGPERSAAGRVPALQELQVARGLEGIRPKGECLE